MSPYMAGRRDASEHIRSKLMEIVGNEIYRAGRQFTLNQRGVEKLMSIIDQTIEDASRRD